MSRSFLQGYMKSEGNGRLQYSQNWPKPLTDNQNNLSITSLGEAIMQGCQHCHMIRSNGNLKEGRIMQHNSAPLKAEAF